MPIVHTCNPNAIDEKGYSNVPAKAVKYTPVSSCLTVTVVLKPQATKEVKLSLPQLMGAHFVSEMDNNEVQSMVTQFKSHMKGTVLGVYMIGAIGVWSVKDNIWKNYQHIFQEIVKGRGSKETRYWIDNKAGKKGGSGTKIEIGVRLDKISVKIDDYEWSDDANKDIAKENLQEAIKSVEDSL